MLRNSFQLTREYDAGAWRVKVFVGDDIVFNERHESAQWDGINAAIDRTVPEDFKYKCSRYAQLKRRVNIQFQPNSKVKREPTKVVMSVDEAADELRYKTQELCMRTHRIDLDGVFGAIEASTRGV